MFASVDGVLGIPACRLSRLLGVYQFILDNHSVRGSHGYGSVSGVFLFVVNIVVAHDDYDDFLYANVPPDTAGRI